MGFRVTGFVIAAVFLLPAHASGQGKAPPPVTASKEKAEAKLHYDKGTIHYNLDEWPQAIAEFRAAYRVFPDPSFLYNIAQCHRRMGNLAESLSFYKNYLRERPDAPNRSDVEKRIDELQTLLASQTKTQPPPPTVTAPPGQGRPAALAPPTPIAAPAGSPSGAATAGPPAPTAASKLESAAPPVQGAAASVPAGADLTAAAPAAAQGAGKKSVFRKWWFWTAVGGAVAAGVIIAVLASSSSESPSPYRGNLDPPVLGVP